MPIELDCGTAQRFRYRLADITLRGHLAVALPVRRAHWRLNGGAAVPFYVEALAGAGIDWRYAYKASPSRLMLPEAGDFKIEIPVTSPGLRPGRNELAIEAIAADGAAERLVISIEWDPRPLPLPLDLRDLGAVGDIQQVGQVVNGRFAVDPTDGHIRSLAPVAPDALLVIGSPHGSQEATYRVRFGDLAAGKYLGLSDFFVGNEDEVPPLGVKTGWSTAGLATLTYGWRPGSPAEAERPPVAAGSAQGEARAWLAFGDNSRQGGRWLVKCEPAARLPIAAGVDYRVRHQVLFSGGVNRVRFRLWPAESAEPTDWLCAVDDAGVAADRPRFRQASFALFQHTGQSTEWWDLHLRPL